MRVPLESKGLLKTRCELGLLLQRVDEERDDVLGDVEEDGAGAPGQRRA